MATPTLWKGLLYIMRCWRTFGIHFLIKALEDGAEEWATCQSAQAAYPLKRSLPIPRSSRGWFCPKIRILEQGSSQLTRWPGVTEHVCGAESPKSLAACQWIYIYIYIYSNLLRGWRRGNTKLLIGHQSGSC